MTIITNTSSAQKATLQQQSKLKSKSKNVHNHNIKPTSEYVGGSYVCTNSNEMKKKLSCAKKNGICGNLQYIPEEKFLFFTVKSAEYAYTCTGEETPKMIREMFGLKKGALRRCDSHIFDANRLYDKNKVVYFYEEDVK